MPTIDQLAPAVVAADDDTLIVSQGGISRRVTRAQLLAGTQCELSLEPGLMGRTSPGLGVPEPIAVGGGLRLAHGILSCPPPYAISSLEAGAIINSSDLIAVSSGGRDKALSVSTLLSSAGNDMSGQLVTAVLGVSRTLKDWSSDELTVEAFGAVGDGATDDTNAFTKAVLSGRPLRLGPKTYRVDGQWTISESLTLLGTPGLSSIRRIGQHGGSWISISGPSFTSIGVTFDAGGVTAESWGVLVTSTCTQTHFENCSFMHSVGGTFGTGLTIQARDGTDGVGSQHTVRNCVFSDNGMHGLWIQAASGAMVTGCSASNNGGYGICLDFNDPSFSQIVRDCIVTGCRCWENQRGISVGNFNETNLEPPRWGLDHPDAQRVLIFANACYYNKAYGIAASGDSLQIRQNQISVGPIVQDSSGILVNAIRSIVSDNQLSGPGAFGIDAGGCRDCEIRDNSIQFFAVGINAGGGCNVDVCGNRLFDNNRSITVFQVETDGQGNNFGISCSDVSITENVIQIPNLDSGGIYLFDGPENVSISRNSFVAAGNLSSTQAIFANTDGVNIRSNQWNALDRFNATQIAASGSEALILPEVFDRVHLANGGGPISSILGQYQVAVSDTVTFVRVIDGGSRYSRANVTISGAGAGAEASAYIRDGVIIGIAMSSGGSGYRGADAVVTIAGDGTGATASASVGLPVARNRRLRIRCEFETSFRSAGSSPFQENSTGSDITIPSKSEIEWTEVDGHWRATAFTCVDYVSPSSDGSLRIRSKQGDLALQSAFGGHLRVRSETELVGYLSCLGRGSPEGVVVAPAGSDYRNLDGGAGRTFWLKQSGDDGFGWAAIG